MISDALNAPAPYRTHDAPGLALAAGVDILLYTDAPSASYGYEELAADAQRSAATRAQLARAVARIRALRTWLGARPESTTLLEAEPLERRFVATPVRAHLDHQLEVDRMAEQLLDLGPRTRTDLLDTEPPLPTTICFCDSVSTSTCARSTLSANSSISTEIACGTSSRVSHSAFSRISSAICSSTERSVRCSCGK